jgi:hypothetical protein
MVNPKARPKTMVLSLQMLPSLRPESTIFSVWFAP